MKNFLIFSFICFMSGSIYSQDAAIGDRGIFDSQKNFKYDDHCEIIFDGIDQNLNVHVKENVLEDLFSFTPQQLKNKRLAYPLMSCTGQIVRIEKDLVAKLNFKIRTQNARTSYGLLEGGAYLRIVVSEGTVIYAYNLKKNKGRIDKIGDYTMYRGNYLINEKDLKMLKKYHVDKLGVVWSQGYEEYDLFNVDFFQRQLACLGYE